MSLVVPKNTLVKWIQGTHYELIFTIRVINREDQIVIACIRIPYRGYISQRKDNKWVEANVLHVQMRCCGNKVTTTIKIEDK